MQNKRQSSQKSIGLKRCYQNIFYILGVVLRYTPGYFVNMCLFQVYCAVQVFLEFIYTLKVLLEFIAEGAEYKDAIAYLLLMFALVIVKLVWAHGWKMLLHPRHRKFYIKNCAWSCMKRLANWI